MSSTSLSHIKEIFSQSEPIQNSWDEFCEATVAKFDPLVKQRDEVLFNARAAVMRLGAEDSTITPEDQRIQEITTAAREQVAELQQSILEVKTELESYGQHILSELLPFIEQMAQVLMSEAIEVERLLTAYATTVSNLEEEMRLEINPDIIFQVLQDLPFTGIQEHVQQLINLLYNVEGNDDGEVVSWDPVWIEADSKILITSEGRRKFSSEPALMFDLFGSQVMFSIIGFFMFGVKNPGLYKPFSMTSMDEEEAAEEENEVFESDEEQDAEDEDMDDDVIKILNEMPFLQQFLVEYLFLEALERQLS